MHRAADRARCRPVVPLLEQSWRGGRPFAAAGPRPKPVRAKVGADVVAAVVAIGLETLRQRSDHRNPHAQRTNSGALQGDTPCILIAEDDQVLADGLSVHCASSVPWWTTWQRLRKTDAALMNNTEFRSAHSDPGPPAHARAGSAQAPPRRADGLPVLILTRGRRRGRKASRVSVTRAPTTTMAKPFQPAVTEARVRAPRTRAWRGRAAPSSTAR